VQVQDHRAAGGDVVENLAAVGADDGLDAEAVGGLQEVGGAVGVRGQEQQDARPVEGGMARRRAAGRARAPRRAAGRAAARFGTRGGAARRGVQTRSSIGV
jgi:hypothetical protein